MATKNLQTANQWKYPQDYIATHEYPETTSIKCNVGGSYSMQMGSGEWGQPEPWIEGAVYPQAVMGIKNEAGGHVEGTEFTLYYSEVQE